ncbi:MAG TPA: Na/Pi cotransporter family protein, partial [Pirellulales bacterium]|nr:Na/Pi cotransporter family protein [Pirellulales bacterium]
FHVELAVLTKLIFTLIGGLGIFLLGMKSMSDGMQAVAGSRLRGLISLATNNRFLATGVGVVITCVVQSSSITTVMVVGFVNSGVMQLSQALGVIMGANIGTTVTGWILVLKIGKYGLPILGAAAITYLFSKGDRLRFWAMVIMGIGMIFFGLELMKDACSLIKEHPSFESWFQSFQANDYFGVLGCALIGCLLTIMVQSSSATLGITISLASQGVISYPTAAALVLGENIGTTVTACLASLGATTNARRAAYFHIIFNLVGVFWITAIFHWYIDLVQWVIGDDVTKVIMVDGKETYNTTATIAATHSIFNITNTLLFLPFLPLFVKLLEKFVPAKAYKEKPHLTDLDIRILETPLLAIEQSQKEIEKMGDGCVKMMDWLKTLYAQDDRDRSLAERLHHRERVLDSVHDELSVFITSLLSGNVPHAAAEEARRQLRMADEYESVSDYLANLDKFDRKLRDVELRFTPEQRKDLLELHEILEQHLEMVNDSLKHRNIDVMAKLETIDLRIRNLLKALRRKHLDDLSSGNIRPQVSVAYLAALNAYARVRDHSRNIAETISGEK